MMEIKVTLSLDESTQDTLNRLIDALKTPVIMGNVDLAKETDKTEAPEPAERPQKLTRAKLEQEAEKPAKVTRVAKTAPTEDEEDTPPFDTDDEPVKPAKKAQKITVEDLRGLLADVKDQCGAAAVKKLLTGMGAAKLSEVPEEQYGVLKRKAEALLDNAG